MTVLITIRLIQLFRYIIQNLFTRFVDSNYKNTLEPVACLELREVLHRTL